MTDNGLAALAAALHHYRGTCELWTISEAACPIDHRVDAAAILGEHGVFLPEGLPEIVENMEDAYHEALALRGATIATLRAALDGLVADFVDEDPDLPDDYPIEWEMTLGSLRSAALAKAKKTP